MNNVERIKEEVVMNLLTKEETLQLGLYLLGKSIIMSTDIPNFTAGIDKNGNILFNPDFMDFTDTGYKEYVTLILLHEILHELFVHFKRAGNKHHMLWNMACDYVINGVLYNIVQNNGIRNVSVSSNFFTDGLLDHKYDGMFEEEIYKLLLDDYKDNMDKLKKIFENGDVEIWKDSSISDKNTITISKTFFSNDDINNNDDGSGGGDSDSDSDSDSDDITNNSAMSEISTFQIKEILRGLSTLANVNLLHNIEEQSRLLKFSAKFRTLIYKIGKTNFKKIWHSPKKSWMVNSKYISMTPNKHKDKQNMFKAVLVVDESGSMSDKELKIILGIIKFFVGRYIANTATVIHHDTVMKVDSNYNLIGKNKKMDWERNFTGGTSHKLPFNYIKETFVTEKILPIILTDMHSDIEQVRDTIANIPCVWVTTSDKNDATIDWLNKHYPDDIIVEN